MNRQIPELLAPAGSLEILKLAVDAGADAVYFGGKAFNARQSAANLDAREIREAVEYCYPRGVKTYLTLNTLVKESEWDELCRFTDEVLPLGMTGLILQDMGAAQYIRRRFPEVELHASTQMSIHNAQGAQWLKELGFCRVVLSRELPLTEVKHITQTVGVETEVFIHGALCYSYSGQCLMSSLIGGRSGNRGRCAQPCRLQYSLSCDAHKRNYLNLKDICTLSDVKALSESGAASLKIEGRLKSAAYVAGVTAAYRRALDYYQATGEEYRPAPEELEELALLFNRGGFSKGYIYGKTGDMICAESPKHSGIPAGYVQSLDARQVRLSLTHKVEPGDTLEIRTGSMPYPSIIVRERGLSENRLTLPAMRGVRKGDEVRLLISKRENREILERTQKRSRPIQLSIHLKKGSRPVLVGQTLDGQYTVQAEGQTAAAQAQSRPLTQEDVVRQLKKTGDSAFCVEEVHVQMDPDLFLPVSELNALRREVTQRLTEELQAPYYTACPVAEAPEEVQEWPEILWEAVVTTEDQLRAVSGRVARVYLRQEFFRPEKIEEYKNIVRGTDTQLCLSLPYIVREKAGERVFAQLDQWKQAGIRRVLVQNMGEIAPVQERGMAVEAGVGIPVMNEASRRFYQEHLEGYTASVELNAAELRSLRYDSRCACMVYGRIPVMLSEQCPAKEGGYCRKGGELQLIDRMQEAWPMERHCEDCYTVFYSYKPVWIANKKRLLKNLPAGKLRLYFLEESGEETEKRLMEYQEETETVPAGNSYISGHYDKGVE